LVKFLVAAVGLPVLTDGLEPHGSLQVEYSLGLQRLGLVAPFCGYAAARGELNIVGVIAAAVFGSMVGQLPWYYAGRMLGEKRIEALAARYGRWLTVTPHEVDRVFAWFYRYGAPSVFFGRMIPAIRAVISLPAGIAEMPLGKFLAYSLAGTTIWMGGLAYAGYRLGQNYELVEEYMGPGTKIVVEGYRAKDGTHRANGRSLTLPDGRTLFVGSSGTGAPEP